MVTASPSKPLVAALSTLPLVAQQRLLFAFLCLVWGTTWLAMKAGVTTVPPAFFSGTRWTAAGLILLVWRWRTGAPIRIPGRLWPRVLVVAFLMIVVNASIQLYGLRSITSGLGAVLTSGVTPLALLGFGVMFGQERFTRGRLFAIGLGVAGLLLLFGPGALSGTIGRSELSGAAAVLIGCLAYCAGSVIVRPAMRSASPAQIAALINLSGGVTLLIGSPLFEPGVAQAATGDWGAAAWAAWWFLLLPGALGATTIYFYLVREWGASRTGTYAFISPVISVVLGIAVFAEAVHPLDAVGMVLMLAAAFVVLRRT